jgi:hypothetical protein
MKEKQVLQPRPREERRPSEHALLALQRSAGNAAVARAVLARDDIVSDPAALAKVESLPKGVLSGNGVKPLANEEQKKHFLRAGKDLWGDYDKALAWFGAIRNVKIPGGAMLHDSAAGRIEAVSAAMGAEMPAGFGGFQFRNEFTAASKFNSLSHHTLGLAIDYDPRDMVRIGQDTNNQTYSVSADLIGIVTGEESHEDLGDYGKRRATIRKLGDATAAGKEAKTVAGGEALLEKIGTETERMGKASAEFQASLGKTRDTFLQLRQDYLAAKAGSAARKDVMAKVPDAIAPWLDAVERTAQKLRDEAKDAGLDPDKLDAGALRKEAGQLDAIVAAGDKLRATYSSDPTQMLAARHEAQVSGWETKLGIKTDPTAEGYTRVELAITIASGRSGQLKDLFGHGPRLKQLAELKRRLTSDATLLFGYSANKTESSPPLAQLIESGFFTPGTPGATGDDRGNFNAKFIQEMARHGFDTGTAWSGAFTDSMHFELVTNLF